MSGSGAPGGAPVRLAAGDGRTLDARVHAPAGASRGAFVVAHPHPAHGGHMDHGVVVAAARRAAARGLLALRFDFGGVRESEGDLADRAAHLRDWRTALADAAGRAPGRRLAGGFSYGARTLAALLREVDAPAVDGVVLLAPATRVPRTRRDFGNLLLGRPIPDAGLDPDALDNLAALAVPAHVIVGDRDVVAPPDELRAHLPPAGVLHVLPGLNHFFSRAQGAGATDREALEAALDGAFEALADAEPGPKPHASREP